MGGREVKAKPNQSMTCPMSLLRLVLPVCVRSFHSSRKVLSRPRVWSVDLPHGSIEARSASANVKPDK